jgi:hypothetical protein
MGLFMNSVPRNAARNMNINTASSISVVVSCVTAEVVLMNVVVMMNGGGIDVSVWVVMLISVNVE